MATLDKIKLSGTTYDIVDSTAIHSLEGYWTTEQTENAITAATNALAESIAEQGYQTSGDVQNAISGKADTTAVTQSITQAVSGKANASDVVTDVHAAIKADTHSISLYVTKGGTQTSSYLLGQGDGITLSNSGLLSVDTTVIAQKSDIPSVDGYADAVKYDSTSQEVKFYHGGTGGTEVFSFDASPFLIDGMIESVVITSITSGGSEVEVLEITWNSAAGGQVTDIPLTDIFDASNYYTTAQTDTKISEATSGKVDASTYNAYTAATDTALASKADTTAVTQAISDATTGKADTTAVTAINDVLTAHTADTAIHVTSSDKSTWNGKQEALVSGTNIKTVGGNSLLGSGNIEFPSGLQVSVTGTTLVFG